MSSVAQLPMKVSRLSKARDLRVPFLAHPLSEKAFVFLARFIICSALATLLILLFDIVQAGISRLGIDFFTNFPSRKAENAGILAAWTGSLYLMGLTVSFALPLGVGAAVYLEEYGSSKRLARIIEICIANLAGVPSVIYGLLGLQAFVRVLRLERSLLSGALTLAILVLPVIIMSAREAIRAVPKGYREGALALGATRWQSIWTQVLPVAFPGILTGCILAFSRAVGETAPLITLGAVTYVAQVPDSLLSPFTALPIQAFNWLSRPQPEFHQNAAAAITVLLIVMLAMNAFAIVLRSKFQRRQR